MTEWWRVKRGEYTFDKRFFLGSIFIMVIFLIIGYAEGGSETHIYASCPKDAVMPCKNKFILEGVSNATFCLAKNKEVCAIPTLWPGQTYGTPPPWIVKNFPSIMGLIFFLAFLGNHFTHNRRFDIWSRLKSSR